MKTILSVLFVLSVALPAAAQISPPACCTTSEASLCDDLIDNDCDTLGDCADPDCATDPACVVPEPSCGDNICDSAVGEDCLTCWYDCRAECPPLDCGDGLCQNGEDPSTCPSDCEQATGLPGNPRIVYDSAHTHLPAGLGGDVPHHFMNLVDGPEAQLWDAGHAATVAPDGSIHFVAADIPAYSIEPPFVAGGPFALGMITRINLSSNGLLGSDGKTCELNKLTTEPNNGAVRFLFRLSGSGSLVVSKPFAHYGDRLAVLTFRDAANALHFLAYDGTAWIDQTADPAASSGNVACFSCLGCYYPSTWPNGGASADQNFELLAGYDVEMVPADLDAFKCYLDHRFHGLDPAECAN